MGGGLSITPSEALEFFLQWKATQIKPDEDMLNYFELHDTNADSLTKATATPERSEQRQKVTCEPENLNRDTLGVQYIGQCSWNLGPSKLSDVKDS